MPFRECPVERRAYYREMARLAGAPDPRFVTPADDSPAAARAGSHKHVSNARMLAELKLTLAYPSYREGLLPELPALRLSSTR